MLNHPEGECDLCGNPHAEPIYFKRGWTLVRCAGCGLVRVHPLPTAAQVAGLYAPTSRYQLHRLGSENRYTSWEARRVKRLVHMVGAPPHPEARLLDVGCSTGVFMGAAREKGWQVRGIETGKHLAQFGRVKFGLDIVYGSVESAANSFAAETFDAITLWDVIEHLRQPRAVLTLLRELLKPGGTLYLATPNIDGWVSQYQYHILKPRGKVWAHPEPPLHLYQFSDKTLRRMLAACGFLNPRFQFDEIPLWYTSGFQGEPTRREWRHGESDVPHARLRYLVNLPVFLAARAARRGDSMIVRAAKPGDVPEHAIY